MCLSAMLMGGMGGGGGNFFSNLPDGTLAKTYRNIMWLVLLVHLGLAIGLIVVAGWTGVYELIACMILFWGNAQANFWCMIMYILRCLIGLIQMFSTAGLILQKSDIDGDTAIFAIAWVFVVFYIIALTAAFYTYREYKALMNSGGEAAGGMGGGNINDSNRPPNPAAGNYQRIGNT